jgi:hypothetical protein
MYEQKLEAASAREIDACAQELARARASAEEASATHSVLLSQVGRLVEAGQRYFRTAVPSAERLAELL